MKQAIKALEGRKNCKTATHTLKVKQTAKLLRKWIKEQNKGK